LATVLQTLNSSPFVTGLTDVNFTMTPHMLEADGPIGATKDGKEILTGGSIGQSVEVYNDNTIVINTSDTQKERFNFADVTPSGTNLGDLISQYYTPTYPIPTGLGCDSLTKLCKKKPLPLNIFWGEIYSVTNGKKETRTIKGETIEKSSQSSLLITRGWEIDCCSGVLELKLFLQVMQGGQTVSFTDMLKSVVVPCEGIIKCEECKDHCEKEKAKIEAAKKAAGKN